MEKEEVKHSYLLEEYNGYVGDMPEVLDMKGVKVRSAREMERWLERVPESIRMAKEKKEAAMLVREEAVMEREEVLRGAVEEAAPPTPARPWRAGGLKALVRAQVRRARGQRTGLAAWLRIPAAAERADPRLPAEYQFPDPVPRAMQDVQMGDLAAVGLCRWSVPPQVDISWRMLTLARPPTLAQANFFSRSLPPSLLPP